MRRKAEFDENSAGKGEKKWNEMRREGEEQKQAGHVYDTSYCSFCCLVADLWLENEFMTAEGQEDLAENLW